MTAYDRAEHEAYTADLEEMFGGRNHPEPDLTRAWIDMRSALPRGLARRVRRWLAAASLHRRPGRYVLTRAAPGAPRTARY